MCDLCAFSRTDAKGNSIMGEEARSKVKKQYQRAENKHLKVLVPGHRKPRKNVPCIKPGDPIRCSKSFERGTPLTLECTHLHDQNPHKIVIIKPFCQNFHHVSEFSPQAVG
eukprot:scaffold1223_cov119-Cylindrotheca_fusiformis.AAC.15